MCFFFFNDTATTEIYTLSLHDALPISWPWHAAAMTTVEFPPPPPPQQLRWLYPSVVKKIARAHWVFQGTARSEEHTSELQSRQYLVCRLLLEKKKKNQHQSLLVQMS